MILLKDEGRDYQRYSHTTTERLYLKKQGFQHVQSSNVSAVARRDDDMIIRFHNGSLYRYSGQGERVDDILKSNSKGKWVWRHLRRKRVPYEKIGTLPLPDDLGITDDDLFKDLEEKYFKDLVSVIGSEAMTREVVFNQETNAYMVKVMIGGLSMFVPSI